MTAVHGSEGLEPIARDLKAQQRQHLRIRFANVSDHVRCLRQGSVRHMRQRFEKCSSDIPTGIDQRPVQIA